MVCMFKRQPIILHSILSDESKNNQTDPSTDKQFGLHAKVKLHIQFFGNRQNFATHFTYYFLALPCK